MAALIKDELSADAELIEGDRGEFSVWVDEERIASKGPLGFPSDEDIITAVKKALS